MPKNKQGSLDSFFGVSRPKKSLPVVASKENHTVEKNHASTNANEEQKQPPIEEEEQLVKRKTPTSGKDGAVQKRRRRVIDDDSDDDDEPPVAPVTDSTADTEPSASSTTAVEDKLVNTKDNKSDTATQQSNEKEPANDTQMDEEEDEEEDTPKASRVAGLKVPKTKTDKQIMEEIPKSWDKEMPYAILAETFEKIEAITGRLQIQDILTTLFRQIMLQSGQDLYHVLYLTSNSVAPAYECVELGIGDAILIKAIGEATGSTTAAIKSKYEDVGDLGTVAQSCKSKQRTLGGFFGAAKKAKGLTAKEVLSVFREIANMKGSQSQKLKVEKIKKILVKATEPAETKYIIRGLQGKLRIGLAQSTVLISLAHSLALTVPTTIQHTAVSKSEKAAYPSEALQYMDKSLPVEKRMEAAVAIIKKAYSEVPSYDAILDAALKVPLQEMHRACTLTPGVPVAPMLAKPTKSIQEVLKRLNGLKFTCEYKYDGERAQVHLLPDGTTKVFSRNLLDTSEKYPEVPLFVKEACKNVDSFVLDAEVVAFNNKTGQFVPFQILSTRKKTEESAETAKVQVIVQAFDLMYLNGKSLLAHTLEERRALMKEHFEEVAGKFQYAKSMDHEENGDTTIIEEFLDNAVKGQCEGLMVKTLQVNAIYEPSRRSLNWLKLKKDYLDGLGDSVDLVPLGAYHGRGKRTGVYGAYLLACYDPDTEELQSVCKIGTGFSDEDLKSLAEGLNKHVIPAKSSQYQVSDQLECDVWFDAVQVWEVKAADLSKSSAHRGAEGKTGEAGRGIGLRFPRFERLREDKKPEEATTSDQILEMYYQQDTIVGGGDDGDDDGI